MTYAQVTDPDSTRFFTFVHHRTMALSSPKKTIPEPKTPTRRSKRGQPVVTAYAGGSSTGVAWTTRNPPRTRPIDPTLDLEGDDAEAWNELDEEEQGKLETRVYDSFSRNKTTAMKKKAPGRKRATTETTTVTDTFCVGDTVLVSTSSREPSIAVIAGLWETDLGAERPLAERMCIRLRWFLRPSQMPKIRAQREHLHVRASSLSCFPSNVVQNEIYYSLKSPGVVSPQAILHPCRVYDGGVPPSIFQSMRSLNRYDQTVTSSIYSEQIPRTTDMYAVSPSTPNAAFSTNSLGTNTALVPSRSSKTNHLRRILGLLPSNNQSK